MNARTPTHIQEQRFSKLLRNKENKLHSALLFKYGKLDGLLRRLFAN